MLTPACIDGIGPASMHSPGEIYEFAEQFQGARTKYAKAKEQRSKRRSAIQGGGSGDNIPRANNPFGVPAGAEVAWEFRENLECHRGTVGLPFGGCGCTPT